MSRWNRSSVLVRFHRERWRDIAQVCWRKVTPGVDSRFVEPFSQKEAAPALREHNDVLSQESASVRLYTLGQVRLERRVGPRWEFVTEPVWYHEDVRTLLASLLSASILRMDRSNHLRSLGRGALTEALWPGVADERSTGLLYKTVHELRNVLEPGRAKKTSELLETAVQSLGLADQRKIWCDADVFELLSQMGSQENDLWQREHLLKEAVTLYQGFYFPGVGETRWITVRRATMHRQAISGFLELADLWAMRGAGVAAIDVLRQAIKLEPANDAIGGRLMQLLAEHGRDKEALHVYRIMVEALRREEDSPPLPASLRELYREIRQRA